MSQDSVRDRAVAAVPGHDLDIGVTGARITVAAFVEADADRAEYGRGTGGSLCDRRNY